MSVNYQVEWPMSLRAPADSLEAKQPAIDNGLDVPDPARYYAADYMQKICINFAKQQIVALSLEWIGTGELNEVGNNHSFGAHLNLVGLQDDGLFYLAMRKGLDYLASHSNVDPNRLGVTGLSGGGWQTVFLSGLDERVAVAVPVAGYSSLQQRVEEQERVEDHDEKSSIAWIRRIVMSERSSWCCIDGREKHLVGFQESLTIG